jgi:hypothetical protein
MSDLPTLTGRHRVAHLPPLRLTLEQFQALPEYSATLPTATTIGKRWRRQDGIYDASLRHYGRTKEEADRLCPWMIGEYAVNWVPDPAEPWMNIPDPKRVKINWYRPVIVVKAR